MTEQPTLVTEAAVAAARDGGDDAGACITTDQARAILAAPLPAAAQDDRLAIPSALPELIANRPILITLTKAPTDG